MLLKQLSRSKDLRRKSHSLQVVIVKRGDEVEPEREAASAMTVSFLKDAKDFESTNHMLS